MGNSFILRVYRYVSLTLLTDCNFTQGVCADDDDDDGCDEIGGGRICDSHHSDSTSSLQYFYTQK